MKDVTKLTLGLLLLLLAVGLITEGCGLVWGVAGSLIGAGVMCVIYGCALLRAMKDF